jgi:hypothetical protein
MKIWVDDVRPAPEGFVWCKSVNEAKMKVVESIHLYFTKPFIDIDHDAGDYAPDGGDYVKLLDWLEEMGYDVTIRIHSMNPVGVENMRRIIQRNGWTEIR